MITTFDITDIMVAKAEQRRVADDLTLLIDTANAPIFGIDGNYLVNEWNRKAAEITGYAKEEVMGRDLVATYIVRAARVAEAERSLDGCAVIAA